MNASWRILLNMKLKKQFYSSIEFHPTHITLCDKNLGFEQLQNDIQDN